MMVLLMVKTESASSEFETSASGLHAGLRRALGFTALRLKQQKSQSFGSQYKSASPFLQPFVMNSKLQSCPLYPQTTCATLNGEW